MICHIVTDRQSSLVVIDLLILVLEQDEETVTYYNDE